MKGLLCSLLLLALTCPQPNRAADSRTAPGSPSGKKIRALLVYGGHTFDTNEFFLVFRSNPELRVTTVEYPAAQEWFQPARAGEYDLLVFYDMWPDMPAERKADLSALIKGGKPLVALHHTLAAFPAWAEYADIIGGRYHTKPWRDQGVEKPASTYLHDVDFKVQIADRKHPVTRGLEDFTIHDETYGGFEVKAGSHVLLTVDHPTSGRDIGWCKTYGAGRVVYLQLGHDHQAYANPSYQRLLAQAIRWAAGTEAP